MFEKILALIEQYDRTIIHRHKNPDGDAIGSQIGLKYILKENYPEKEIYAVGDAAGRYAFIEDSTPDVVADELYEGALAIILDTSAKSLISDDRYEKAAATARIDHHLFCETIAEVEVTDSTFESCCGLITSFAIEAGLSVSAKAAKLLYTGMITDSGRFRYDSTSAKTFRMAAFLMEKGFRTEDIYRNLYADDLAYMQLRARFTLKINLTDRHVAYTYTTREEAETLGFDTFTISRGMVGVMSDIRGIDSWVGFTETADGVLCEIRSAKYNINSIAKKYGGGGHAKASGATLRDREEAMRLLDDLCALSEETI